MSTLPDNAGDYRFWTKSPGLTISMPNLPDKHETGKHINFLMFLPIISPGEKPGFLNFRPKMHRFFCSEFWSMGMASLTIFITIYYSIVCLQYACEFNSYYLIVLGTI